MDADAIQDFITRQSVKYADARIVHSESSSIRVRKGEVDAVSSKDFGVSVRVLSSSWGFASSNRREDFVPLFKKALRLSRIGEGKERISPEEFSNKKVCVKTKAKKDPLDVDIGEKVSLALSLEKEMKGVPIADTSVSLMDSHAVKTFLNSEGAFIEQTTVGVYCSMTAIGKKNGLVQEGTEVVGGRKGYEVLKNAASKANKAKRKAIRLLSSSQCPKGRYTVVIDGLVGGLLAHEGIGHASEADAVLSGSSILSNKLNKRIGSGLVNVVDDPTADGFGSYLFDDEGIRGRKITLVRAGVLRGFLHSRTTALSFHTNPTGNCRASSYSAFPLVRMSNTFFERGSQKKDDLFDIRKGIYLKGAKGGSVDPITGNFVFAAEEGRMIENGEVKRSVRNALLSGNILKTLLLVEAVGSDFSSSPGFCGKDGQLVPVGDGGPHMRIRDVLVG
jgi:TldD protein